MEIWKFAPFGAACALLCAALKKRSPEHAMLLGAAGCACILLGTLTFLPPVLDFLRRLQSLAGMNPALLTPILKTAAVGLLAQIARAFCLDAGQNALAKAVEVGGGILSVYTLLPLAGSMVELLQRMVT